MPLQMARNEPLAVLVLAVLMCAYEGRPVMMAPSTRYVASWSTGTIAKTNRNDPIAGQTAGTTGDGPRSPGAILTAIGQHGSAIVNENASLATRRSRARSRRSSHVDSDNTRHGHTGFSTFSHSLSSGPSFASSFATSNTGAVRYAIHDVFESRPLFSSLPVPMTAVTIHVTSGIPKSSPSSRLLILNTAVTRASSDGIPEISSLPQLLTSKTSVTSVKGSVFKSSSRFPASKNGVTSASSGVSGTTSVRPPTSKKFVTNAPSSVPKSSLTPQLLVSKTTLPSDNKSSQLLDSKMAATRTTSDIPKSSSEQLLSNISTVTNDVLLSSPKLISNMFATRTTNGVLMSSSKLQPLKIIVTSTTMSGVPKTLLSQLLNSKTSSTRYIVGVSEASFPISKTSVTMSKISESSSSQLPATKIGIVRLEVTSKRSFSRDISKVRRTNDKITPRYSTRYSQAKVYNNSITMSNTCSTEKCDPSDGSQDPSEEPFLSNDIEQVNVLDDDKGEYVYEENLIFLSHRRFIFTIIVIIFILLSYLIIYYSLRSSDQSRKDDLLHSYLRNVECECCCEYKRRHS